MGNCKLAISQLIAQQNCESMMKVKKVDPTIYKSLVGNLRCLTCTRSDILFGVGVVSRFMEAPTSTDMIMAKRIM